MQELNDPGGGVEFGMFGALGQCERISPSLSTKMRCLRGKKDTKRGSCILLVMDVPPQMLEKN